MLPGEKTSRQVHMLEAKGGAVLQGRKHWMERFGDTVDLHMEPLPLESLVELAGDRRVLVENHYGVCQYSPEKICVKVRWGMVAVSGQALELTRMTKEQLVITGKIVGINLIRRD